MENLTTPEASTEVTQENQPQASEQPKNLLFGTIGYNEEANYETFLKTMNPQQAIFVLISSANYAQMKGSFSMHESETLATAIRTLRKPLPETTEETTQP